MLKLVIANLACLNDITQFKLDDYSFIQEEECKHENFHFDREMFGNHTSNIVLIIFTKTILTEERKVYHPEGMA